MKNIFVSVLRYIPILLILGGTSCSNFNPNTKLLKGSWVKPIADDSKYQWGFTLEDNGAALTINSKRTRYDTWAVDHEQLILNGRTIKDGKSNHFTDTLQIIELNDQSLVLLNEEQKQLKYTKVLNVEKVIKLYNDPNKCYKLIANGDTVSLSISIIVDQIEGILEVNSIHQIYSRGIVNGSLLGDTLIWDVVFDNEGIQSYSQVAFLKDGDDLIQGYGDMILDDELFKFKNLNTIEFIPSLALKRIFCSEK